LSDLGGGFGQAEGGLDGFALVEGAGAEDEGAVGDGFGEGFVNFGVAEQVGGAHGGFSLHPVHGERGNYAETAEAEVGHGAGGCADVEGVARGDEDYFDAVGLGGGKQGLILKQVTANFGSRCRASCLPQTRKRLCAPVVVGAKSKNGFPG